MGDNPRVQRLVADFLAARHKATSGPASAGAGGGGAPASQQVLPRVGNLHLVDLRDQPSLTDPAAAPQVRCNPL